MQKIDYYAVSRSMYGLLRNKRISYKGHLQAAERKLSRHACHALPCIAKHVN